MKKLLIIILLLVGNKGWANETSFVKSVHGELSRLSVSFAQKVLVLNKIETYFDFEELFKVSTRDFSAKMSKSDYQKLEQIFVELLQKRMSSKLNRLFGKNIKKPSYQLTDAAKHEVLLKGFYEKQEIDIVFYLKPRNNSWVIIDLSVESALLSRNYQGQFNRIFRVEGVSGLEKRMVAQMAEVEDVEDLEAVQN